MRLIFVALVFIALAAWVNNRPTYNPTIQAAETALFKSCPDLIRYSSDFDSSTATIENDQDHWKWVARDHGWTEWVMFTFVVSEQPVVIPENYYAQGHHLRYYVGIKNNPGIDVSKKTAGQFCKRGRFDGFIAHN